MEIFLVWLMALGDALGDSLDAGIWFSFHSVTDLFFYVWFCIVIIVTGDQDSAREFLMFEFSM